MKILIVYPDSNISANPTMEAILEGLSRRQHEVDVLCTAVDDKEIADFRPFANFQFQHPGFFGDVSSTSRLYRLYKVLRTRGNGDVHVWHSFRLRQYDCLVGVDPKGIVTASQLNDTVKAKLAYISFELLLQQDADGPYEEALLKAEVAAVHECDTVLIQDPERADIFCKAKDIAKDRIVYGAVAPRRCSPRGEVNLRALLNLTADQKIVLFQGSVSHWAGRDAWADLLHSWPSDCVLVVKSKRALTRREKYYLTTIGGNRIRILDSSERQHNLIDLTASADIGLVTYQPCPDNWETNDNLRFLGLASGKFAYNMMCGIPVLTNNATTLGRLVEDHRVGRAFNTPIESGDAVLEILNQREQFSENARTFYRDFLDPELWMNGFIARLTGVNPPRSLVKP